MPLHRGDLRRLVLERIEPVLVAGDELQRRRDRDHPERHREHGADRRCPAPLEKVIRAGRADHERRREIGGDHHVHEAIGEGRVEDDRKPVARHELAGIVHRVAGRRLHPAVRREDPERGDERPDGDADRSGEMHVLRHAVDAEEHDPEEARLQEEGGHHLVAHQRADHRAGLVGEDAPVRAELVGEHDARDDAHAEGQRERLHPDAEERDVALLAGDEPKPFERGEIGAEADRERRKDDVERDGEGELDAREKNGIDVFKHASKLPRRGEEGGRTAAGSNHGRRDAARQALARQKCRGEVALLSFQALWRAATRGRRNR